jgi:hypothetical protein
MRRLPSLVLVLFALVLSARAGLAQTPAERCLSMRLALLGSAVSTQLHCHAWAVGTRTPAAEACLAHGENALAERLRGAGCASEEETATLIGLARASSAALVEAQVVESRVAELEAGLWSTEAIIDYSRTYDPAMPWPDTSCRSTGFCADLHIIACDTTEGPSGALDTTCTSVPESRYQTGSFPVFVLENTALPTGEILSRAGDGSSVFEVIVTLAPDGATYTGRGHLGTLPIFIEGRRVH